jgi:lysophospholipase L1-like esterase
MALPWKRFIVPGDRLTEGVGDPIPGGLRGWADRLADGLKALDPTLVYENLAYRGLTTAEVRDAQLERVLESKPDLTAAVVGMNDLIEPGFDPSAYDRDLASLVQPLSETGATVLTATYPDVSMFLRAPRRIKESLRRRLVAANEVVREVSRRYDTLMIDADDLVDSTDPRSFSVDRLHPGPRGHLLIGHAFAAVLSERAGVPIVLADPDTGRIGANKFVQARWILTQTTPRQILRFVARSAKG